MGIPRNDEGGELDPHGKTILCNLLGYTDSDDV